MLLDVVAAVAYFVVPVVGNVTKVIADETRLEIVVIGDAEAVRAANFEL